MFGFNIQSDSFDILIFKTARMERNRFQRRKTNGISNIITLLNANYSPISDILISIAHILIKLNLLAMNVRHAKPLPETAATDKNVDEMAGVL